MTVYNTGKKRITGTGGVDDLSGQRREQPFFCGIAALDAFAAEGDIYMRHA